LKQEPRKIGWLLFLFYVIAYLLFLGERPILRFDEARYAEIPREMIESGDWVVPRLNGVRYFEKPTLGYWLTALSIQLLEKTGSPCAWSPPSQPGSAPWRCSGSPRFRDRRPSPRVCFRSRSSESPCFCPGYPQPARHAPHHVSNSRPRLLFRRIPGRKELHEGPPLGLVGCRCRLRFLMKGFLGVVLPSLAILPFLAWERKLLAWLPRLWIPLLTACLLVLPWSLLIHAREPDFWRYFLWEEHWKRLLSQKARMRTLPGTSSRCFWAAFSRGASSFPPG